MRTGRYRTGNFYYMYVFFSFLDIIMAPRKGKKEVKEEVQVQLGPQVREGELVFGVAHIFASFNDTFVHVTDLSGRETICRSHICLHCHISMDTVNTIC